MTDQLPERPHARISPSSFARVANCTMSVRLTAAAPAIAPGPDAAAGTVAHAILERCLKEGLDTFEIKRGPVQVDGHEVTVNEDMLGGVQMALDWVRANMAPPLRLEERLDLPFAIDTLGEPIWGYVDVASDTPVLTVLDFKNGHNPVASDAPQLRLYLLMELLRHKPAGAPGDVAGRTVVCQPNAGGISVAEHTFADMEAFQADVAAVLKRLRRGDLSYADGPWCRFCSAAAFCPHLRSVAVDSALAKVTPTPELIASGEWSAAKLDEAMQLADQLDAWIRAVQRAGEDYLVHGGQLEHYKLVRKRTNRRWIEQDETAVATALQKLGIDPWHAKLASPAEAERRARPVDRPRINGMTEKPEGALTIAERSDERPAVEVAAALQRAVESTKARGFLTAAESRSTLVPKQIGET